MIGLDTNVIIRYLVQDDPEQSKQASKIIEKTSSEGEILWISLVTLCKVVWVLERCYNSGKKELVEVVKALLHTQQVQIEHEDVVRQALQDFNHSVGVDFSDCLIGRQNTFSGCSFTYTFDKAATKKLTTTFKSVA